MAETSTQYLYITEENREKVIRTLKKLIFQRRTKWLGELLGSINPYNLALLWEAFSENEQEIILSQLSQESSADLLTELGEHHRSEIFRSKNTEWILHRLEELDSDDIVDILKSLDTREASFIMRSFEHKYSEKIKHLLNYREETAGSLMTIEFLAVRESARVESIVKQFRRIVEREKLEDIHFIYVVDRQFQLLGYIPLRALILQDPDKIAREIMKPPLITVTPDVDQEEVARIFREYDLISLPVVDETYKLIGRITVDDVVDVLTEEASEDILRLGGVHQDEDISTPAIHSVRKRLPWLVINLTMQAVSAWIVTFFEPTLAALVLLAPLMTIVSGQGGNAAVQSISVIVRSLAMGTLNSANALRTVGRQAVIGLLTGMSNGLLIGTAVYFYTGKPVLSAILFGAMTANMFLAGLVGTLIPLTLKKSNVDPALASGPLVTTITDIFGFTSFLGLSTLLIRWLVP